MDSLSRSQHKEKSTNKNYLKSSRWKRHIKHVNNKEVWVFDIGKERTILKYEERNELIMKVYIETVHRSLKFVYFELKKEYYWTGIKNDIKETLKKC